MGAEIFVSVIPIMVICILSLVIGLLVAFYFPGEDFCFNTLFYSAFSCGIIFVIELVIDLNSLSKNPLPSSKLLMLTPYDWILALIIVILVLVCGIMTTATTRTKKIPANIRWINGPTLIALTAALLMTLTGSNLPTHKNMYLVRGRVYIVEKDKQTGGTNFILRDDDKNLHLLRTNVVIDTQSIEYNLGAEPYLSLVCASDKDPVHKIKDVTNLEKETPEVQVCKSDPLVTENDLDTIVTPIEKGKHRWSLAYF